MGGGLCTAPGGLEGRGKWGSVGWLCAPYPPSPKPPHTPQEASYSSLEAKDPASLLPHCSSPCSSHFLHPTRHAHLGGVPCSPEEGAVETPPRGSPHQPLCSCSLFRPPWPGPRPGAQTWALRLAAVLSKVVFRPSDLQVLFYVALGELGAPSTWGHPWFPSPTWPCCLGPSSWHKHYQDLQLVLGDSAILSGRRPPCGPATL